MKVIFEEIEGAFYQDILISDEDINDILKGHCIDNQTRVNFRTLYSSIRPLGFSHKCRHLEEDEALLNFD